MFGNYPIIFDFSDQSLRSISQINLSDFNSPDCKKHVKESSDYYLNRIASIELLQ